MSSAPDVIASGHYPRMPRTRRSGRSPRQSVFPAINARAGVRELPGRCGISHSVISPEFTGAHRRRSALLADRQCDAAPCARMGVLRPPEGGVQPAEHCLGKLRRADLMHMMARRDGD